MITWLFKKLKRSLFFHGLVQRRQRLNDYRTIADSGLFNAAWYCQRYPEVAANKGWRRDPLQHFLAQGAAEGKSPGPDFDTYWYQTAYPDVLAAGVNPLLHYVRAGCKEGRLPTMLAEPALAGTPDATQADFLNARAWAGYASHCLPLLQQLAQSGDQAAQWYLAAWRYGHGDFEAARQHFAMMAEASELSRLQRIALAKCCSVQGDADGLQRVLAPSAVRFSPLENALLQANLACLKSNSVSQLQAMNLLYQAAGLAELTPIAPAAALSIRNLEATVVPAVQGPLISVVIPAFNCADTIEIALNSLMQQSWHNLEVIVVDDASTDGTGLVVQRWCEQDSRIRYVRHAHNLGAYAARNQGMQLARGEFVTVHDSDDWSHPEKLARQVQPLLQQPATEATLSFWVRVLPDLRFVGPWCLNATFLEKNYSSLLLRKRVLQQIGGWDPVFVAADGEFIQRLQRHYGSASLVSILPECPLSFGLVSADSLTQQSKFHVKSHFYGLRRLYRESYTCWHRREGAPVLPAHERAFPAPVGMLSKQPVQLDVLLLADLAAISQHCLKQLAQMLQKYVSEGKRCGIFHWPAFADWPQREVAADVFELCHRFGVVLIEPDARLEAQSVQLLQAALLSHYPDTLPQVTGVFRLLDEQGQELSATALAQRLQAVSERDNLF